MPRPNPPSPVRSGAASAASSAAVGCSTMTLTTSAWRSTISLISSPAARRPCRTALEMSSEVASRMASTTPGSEESSRHWSSARRPAELASASQAREVWNRIGSSLPPSQAPARKCPRPDIMPVAGARKRDRLDPPDAPRGVGRARNSLRASQSVPTKGPRMDARHTGNLLLDAIPVDEREALLIDVAKRAIDIGGTWLAAGDQIDSVLFPISGSMSLIAETGDSSVEAATVGREGVVDVFAALASRIAPQRVIGQVPGSFLAIPVDHFQKVYDHSPAVRRLIQGYIEALFVQISVNAACLAVHHL